MRARELFVLAVLAAALAAPLAYLGSGAPASRADDPKPGAAKAGGPRVVLAETRNAVTKVHFTNVAVHKGSPEPNPVKRRFRADVTYWLMDARTYETGELGIGNPELVDLVRKVGGKSLPASEPTTLSAMAYGIARAVLDKYPAIRKIEVRLAHFSKGLEPKDEGEDNHVATAVLER